MRELDSGLIARLSVSDGGGHVIVLTPKALAHDGDARANPYGIALRIAQEDVEPEIGHFFPTAMVEMERSFPDVLVNRPCESAFGPFRVIAAAGSRCNPSNDQPTNPATTAQEQISSNAERSGGR